MGRSWWNVGAVMAWLRPAAAGIALTTIAIVSTTWLLGWIDMSRAVGNPVKIWSENPAELALDAVIVALVAAVQARLSRLNPWWSVPVVFLILQVLGSAFVAPLAINELGIENAPVVLAVVSGLGVLPLAAVVGAWLERRRSSRRVSVVPVIG